MSFRASQACCSLCLCPQPPSQIQFGATGPDLRSQEEGVSSGQAASPSPGHPSSGLATNLTEDTNLCWLVSLGHALAYLDDVGGPMLDLNGVPYVLSWGPLLMF